MSDKCKLVIVLEPVPKNFAVLYNSIKYSGLKNVIALPFAAGDTIGEAFIVKPKYGTDEMNTVRKVEHVDSVQEEYLVKLVTLDALLDSLSIHRVNIIKIDVEGFEANVLKGLKNKRSKTYRCTSS